MIQYYVGLYALKKKKVRVKKTYSLLASEVLFGKNKLKEKDEQ